MLSIAALGMTDYHARQSQQTDYYDPTQSGERPGVFVGRGAALLGLDGTVTRDQHRQLIRGFHPVTGKPLRQTAGRANKQTAYDLVFSAPKTTSIAWALAPAAERARIERAFELAVRMAIRRIEAATYTRVGRRGTPVAAKPVVAVYQHTSSRAGDPQLHTHVVVFNVAVRSNGKTGAILSRPYFIRKMAWGALFRCDLTQVLRRAFAGIEFGPETQAAEIAGVPDDVVRHFSKRRRDMQAAVPDLGSMTAAAKAVLALKTRPRKEPVAPLVDRLEAWRNEAHSIGFEPSHIAGILSRTNRRAVDASHLLDTAFAAALDRVTERQSHFSELDILRHTADASTGRGVSGRQIERYVADRIQRSAGIVHLGRFRGQERYSTPDILAEEQMLVDRAVQMTGRRTHRITTFRLAKRLSLDHVAAYRQWFTLDRDRSLNAEQRAAIRAIAGESGRIAVLDAAAGTPRVETLTRLAGLYKAAGNNVLAIAPSAGGARRLGDAAETPHTSLFGLLERADRDRSLLASAKHAAKQLVREAVGRYIGLYSYRRKPFLDDKTILIVDRAERISTPDMARLVQHVERSGAKLILAGNTDGLQSIDRGVPFASLARRIPTARLTEATRPRRREDARNVKKLTEGRSREVLDELARRQRLHVQRSPEQAIEKLMDDWQQAGGARQPREHLILVGNRDDAARINDLAARRRRDSIGEASPANSIILPGGEKIFAGDRVLCTKTSRRHDVQSGSLGTVVAVSRRLQSARVELDDSRQVTLPLATYPHVTRGYAVSIWHAVPAKHAYALLSGSYEDRQSAIAKFSQATDRVQLYTDQQTAGAELNELARQIAADRRKTLAIDVQQQPEQHHEQTN